MYLFFIGAVRNDFEAGNNHYKGHHKGWALKSDSGTILYASCVQSRQFFASTLREQLFELKNEDTINLRLSNHKSESLRVTCGC